jgi:DUF4097 and DUF4098 domain-containing protein YvlB
VLLRNLVGRIEVQGHDGQAFEVEIRVSGRDASPERVRIEATEGAYAEVIVEFPLGESRRYVYPALGDGRSSFSPEGGSWLAELFGGSRIEVAGRGRGLEIWADATVRVPRGRTLRVEHGVGAIVAADVTAKLDLVCQACPIDVADVEGTVGADTGSGSISVHGVHGDVSADSGSGAVELGQCRGTKVLVDTGSGGVALEEVEAERLSVDTGSGSVRALKIGANDVLIDTGSGGVELELVRMGPGEYRVDTGSGTVELRLPADASAKVRADTGSGRIRLDLGEGYEVLSSDDTFAELRIGSGAARVELDTGSGMIRISQ